MGLPTATIGHTTVGVHVAATPSHAEDGQIVTGNPLVLVGGMSISRIGDVVLSSSHSAVGTIVTGSGTVVSAGMGVARLGDYVVGDYEATIIEGHPLVLTGL